MNLKSEEKIHTLQKAENISLEVLAQYLGVCSWAVSKWENGIKMSGTHRGVPLKIFH